MFRLKFVLLMVCSLLLVPSTLYAQDDDGQAIIIAALANLHEYDFQLNMQASNHVQQYQRNIELYQMLTEYDDEIQHYLNGDFYLQRQVRSTTLIQGNEEGGTLAIDRAFVDGEDYVKITILEGAEMVDFEFPSGWIEYRSFIEGIDAVPVRAALANILNVDSSLEEFDWQGELITQVTEHPREIIDGVELRLFEVEIDEIELLYRVQMRSLGLEDDDPSRPPIPEGFTIETQRRFWVGAEDHRLYRMELTGFTSIPFSEMRTDTTVETTFVFSHYGDVAPIVAPVID
jgi:hypothetical protein